MILFMLNNLLMINLHVSKYKVFIINNDDLVKKVILDIYLLKKKQKFYKDKLSYMLFFFLGQVYLSTQRELLNYMA